jgi:hypothetical protein
MEPKQSRPTRLRQKWFIYASLLTVVIQRSLIRPVDVTAKLIVVERMFAQAPQGNASEQR